jgi:hypothetical protein
VRVLLIGLAKFVRVHHLNESRLFVFFFFFCKLSESCILFFLFSARLGLVMVLESSV